MGLNWESDEIYGYVSKFCGLLWASSLAASSVYQINFTGTINNGTVHDFNFATDTFEQTTDLTGRQVSGWIQFDLGNAPAPVVTIGGNGAIMTEVVSHSLPIFVSEHFDLGPLSLAPSFAPIPTTFDLVPIPSLPRVTTVTQSINDQDLLFSTLPTGGAQAVFPSESFSYALDGPQLHYADQVSVFELITGPAGFQQFFPVLPQGGIPASWAPPTTGSGVFTFFEVLQNPTITDATHGISVNYQASGAFTIESASGAFLNAQAVPEPGPFRMVLLPLVLFAMVRITNRYLGSRPQ